MQELRPLGNDKRIFLCPKKKKNAMNTTESSLREHPVFPDVNYDVPKHTTDFQKHFQPM